MTREVILQTLQNEPTLTGLIIGGDLDSSVSNYFGIGISNRHGLTENLPFDTLSMILLGELTKRKLALDDSRIIVADEHAKANGFNAADIDRIAKSQKYFLERTLNKLGFNNWKVVLGSEIAKDPQYKEILAGIDEGNQYERAQLADMELYRRLRRGIKIGWKHGTMEFDERHFDELYRKIFGNETTFVYTEAGKSLDGIPQPPYLNNPGRTRLLLISDEDLDSKVSQMSRRVRVYFNNIVDLYERILYGSIKTNDSQNSSENLRKRLREVYGTIFGGRYI